MKLYKIVLFSLLLSLNMAAFSQARVQVIHNSADAAAAVVDVWLNNTLLIDDFEFRTASPFIDAPAGTEFTIAIQPSNSTNPNNPLWSQQYTLMNGETYILVANGLIDTENYDPFVPFDIYVYAMGREVATNDMNTDVLVFHGSTDAPVVDVVEVGVGAGTIVDDLAYSDFDGYLELPTLDFSLQVRNAAGTDVVAQYAAPLATLQLDGAAISVIASGFLNPANNNDGEAFGLYVALASGGDLIALPQVDITTARVQVIHNSADAAAEVVDVWLNDILLIDDFTFRTATPFIDAPAGVEFTIAILPSNSESPENPIWSNTYTLAGNEKYILVANGLVVEANYDPFVPFNIYVYAMGREVATNGTNTDVLVFHGSTDAPVVDVVEVGVGAGTIVDDLAYSNFDGYLELPTLDFSLQVRNAAGTDVVAQYAAPLATLQLDGAAISVIASGFLNPANNNDGEAFGLYVALASGGDLIALPQVDITTARVQVIHNSADAAAEVVDVWLNDILLIDDFTFRTATPFIDAPAGVEFTIAILPSDSESPENPIWSNNYTLDGTKKYILVANGLVVEANYNPFIPFDIYVYAMGREVAIASTNTDVLVFHGSTDAPVVDVVEVGVGAGTIVDNLEYGVFADYLELPTNDYVLDIRDETGTVTVATYSAPLETLGLFGYSASVVASGFLDPSNNNNGASFGLYAVLATGGSLIPLPVVTSVMENVTDDLSLSVFPVPARDAVNISMNLEKNSNITIEMYNLLGNIVYQSNSGMMTAGLQSGKIDVSNFAEGMYFVRVNTGTSTLTTKVKIVK